LGVTDATATFPSPDSVARRANRADQSSCCGRSAGPPAGVAWLRGRPPFIAYQASEGDTDERSSPETGRVDEAHAFRIVRTSPPGPQPPLVSLTVQNEADIVACMNLLH
jgi:hypothetical protein